MANIGLGCHTRIHNKQNMRALTACSIEKRTENALERSELADCGPRAGLHTGHSATHRQSGDYHDGLDLQEVGSGLALIVSASALRSCNVF